MGIGANTEKGGMAEADEPGEAGKHHQRQGAQPEDQHQAEIDQIVGQQDRQHEEAGHQGEIPVALEIIAEEA